MVGFRRLLLVLTILPAFENIWFHDIDEAGTHGDLQTHLHECGYSILRVTQYFNGSSVCSNCGSFRYLSDHKRSATHSIYTLSPLDFNGSRIDTASLILSIVPIQ